MAAQMLEAVQWRGYRLIEAFHDRYHPLSAELDAVKASGMGEEPTVVRASGSLNPLGADLSVAADLQFPSGAKAIITSAMLEEPGHLNSSLEVVGTEGKLVVKNMVFPSREHSITLNRNGLDRAWTVRGLETYDHQLEAIVQGLQSGQELLTEGSDSLAYMKIIDGLYAAAGFGPVK